MVKNYLIIRLPKPTRFSKTKGGILLISLVCFILMLNLSYDRDFVATAILPFVYFLLVYFCVGEKILSNGLGTFSLLIFYSFRMCILPVICALGNFYLEPNKSDYIDKYNTGILLTCFEAVIVFLSLFYFCNHNRKKNSFDEVPLKSNNKHLLLYSIVVFLTLFIIIVCFLYQISYFHFITEEAADVLLDDIKPVQKMHTMWYITDFACTLWRPLFSFVLIYLLLNRKNKRISYFMILLVASLNVMFMSDRRIFALLVGGFCFYYLMTLIENKIAKKYIQISIFACAICTVYYCFYGSMTTGLWLISRTFQHYFSGPTLTAMALEVNDRIGIQFFDFFKLLLNNFYLYIGSMGAFILPDYYSTIFGVGAWTPMVAGSMRYFGIFFPIVIVFVVRYIVNCDYKSQRTNDELYKMIYSYLAVTVSCYMIMYTVELIMYFILSNALIYRLLIRLDSGTIRLK